MKTLAGWIAILVLPGLFSGVAAGSSRLPAGYESAIRPDPPGTPTEVKIGIRVIDVAKINDVDQTFTADILFTIEWVDERLKAGEAGFKREFPLSAVWNPKLGVVNRRNVSFSLPEIALVDHDGVVTTVQRAYGPFALDLDLREFPQDAQVLRLDALSYRYEPDEVALLPYPKWSGSRPSLTIPGWIFSPDDTRVEIETASTGELARDQMVWSLPVIRDRSHFRYSMLIPLALIAFMAWSVFWIDPAYLPSQIAVSTSSIFTLIAFRFSLGLFLPKVSYMTRADLLVLGVTVLVFSCLVQAVVTGWMAKNGREDQARSMDRWGRWIYLSAFVAVVFFSLGTKL